MAANLFRKYVWLTDTIYSAGRITFSEINRKWQSCSLNEYQGSNLSRRTFCNWRNEIEELFGLDIHCDLSDNMYYIANADDLQDSTTQRWLLNTFAVTNLVSEAGVLKDKILLEDMPSGAQFLAPIMEAIREGRKLTVHYQRFDAPEGHYFEMEPYCVKAFKLRWYMAGRSSDHPNEVRVYGLDRVHEIKILDEHYTIPEDFQGADFFRNYFGVFVGNAKPTKIKVKVKYIDAQYMRSLPLHHSQRETERNTDYSIFEFFVAPTFDFIQELRTYGAQLEVLEPQSIVDDFIKLTKQYDLIYGKKQKK